jgi:hypothetical protein
MFAAYLWLVGGAQHSIVHETSQCDRRVALSGLFKNLKPKERESL